MVHAVAKVGVRSCPIVLGPLVVDHPTDARLQGVRIQVQYSVALPAEDVDRGPGLATHDADALRGRQDGQDLGDVARVDVAGVAPQGDGDEDEEGTPHGALRAARRLLHGPAPVQRWNPPRVCCKVEGEGQFAPGGRDVDSSAPPRPPPRLLPGEYPADGLAQAVRAHPPPWRDSQTSALLDHVVQAEGAPHARVVVEEGKDVLRRGGGVMARAGTRLTPAPAPLPALVVHEEAVRQKHLAAPYGATPPRVVGQKAGSQRGEAAALVVRRRGTKTREKIKFVFPSQQRALISSCESWHLVV